MDNDPHLNVSEDQDMVSVASPREAGDDAGGNTGSGYSLPKRLVVEKVPAHLSKLRDDFEYTKAKNRDLKRLASEEREKVYHLNV
jgi:hypothetical protein